MPPVVAPGLDDPVASPLPVPGPPVLELPATAASSDPVESLSQAAKERLDRKARSGAAKSLFVLIIVMGTIVTCSESLGRDHG
jgi:hypothetical protein